MYDRYAGSGVKERASVSSICCQGWSSYVCGMYDFHVLSCQICDILPFEEVETGMMTVLSLLFYYSLNCFENVSSNW